MQILFVPSRVHDGGLKGDLSEREYEQRKQTATEQGLAQLADDARKWQASKKRKKNLHAFSKVFATALVIVAVAALVFPVAHTPLHMGTELVLVDPVRTSMSSTCPELTMFTMFGGISPRCTGLCCAAGSRPHS